MSATILCSETFNQAMSRRMAGAQRAFTVTVKTAAGVEELNVLAFTSCDAIVRALDILFDGEQPMPVDGLSISAFPFLPRAA